jgi:hypothetical protein
MQPTQHPVIAEAVTPASILRAAGGYLHHYGWNQGDLFDNPDRPTPAACALGAIRMAVMGTPQVWTEHLRTDVLAAFDRAVGVLADHLVNAYGVEPVETTCCTGVVFPADLEQTVSRWNDHPTRIASHVIAALNGAADDWDRIHGSAPAGQLPECCPHRRPIGACECDAATELAELTAELSADIPDGAA